MKQYKKGSWWGLYALLPIMAALLYLAHRARVGQAVHEILLLAVAVVVAYLTLLWSAKHADLLGSEAASAQSESDSLAAAGVEAARYSPSLTATQAHYRKVMQAGSVTDPKTMQ